MMNEFQLIKADNIQTAVDTIKNCDKKIVIKAGGTDLLGGLKREIHQDYPEYVVDISDIADMDYIKEENGYIKIGALTTLKTIAHNQIVKDTLEALAEAALHTASPNLRVMGSIGGNICQENRCWYYRAKDNFFHCKVKGGKKCFAPAGDNRMHSIMGPLGGCFAVNPSDTAPALVALDAKIVTTNRTIDADKFWTVSHESCTVLEKGEIVVEICIPVPPPSTKSTFIKHALRPTIDFPIVNCAVSISPEKVRICLNAVGPIPYRAIESEELLTGKDIDEDLASMASELAFKNARALSKNAHKIQIAKTLLKRSLLKCK